MDEVKNIFDAFCGGGTTGVAALRLDRGFIGIEIDEKAIATTAERLSKVECDFQPITFSQPLMRRRMDNVDALAQQSLNMEGRNNGTQI